jgi:hypothetical protein
VKGEERVVRRLRSDLGVKHLGGEDAPELFQLATQSRNMVEKKDEEKMEIWDIRPALCLE